MWLPPAVSTKLAQSASGLGQAQRWTPIALPLLYSTIGPPPGSTHRWLGLPVQSQIWSWVPFVVVAPGSSRQRPDTGLISEPLAPACQTWLLAPVQVQSCTSVPLVVPKPLTSMHLPWNCRVPSGMVVHTWLGLPAPQSQSC